ncbi:josephin-like protein isoform X1 [Musa acuminata AAA Group]|uniref:josephin-like protein isoform X1 n=1 Tax=Musa acuminata AAA Group TaxID=214697 RepID=UPI0031E4474D
MDEKPIYHEKQRLQFCLLHALNNLMQFFVVKEKDSFRRAELDAIAEKLLADDPFRSQWTPLSLIFKPHHNVFTGNYDVNVLIAALESRRKRVVWHDRRNGASSINLAEESLLGIMLNIPVRRFGGVWSGRHWVSLRNINGVWYNLDSDLASPVPFEHQEEMREFLNNVIDQGGEILIILREKL